MLNWLSSHYMYLKKPKKKNQASDKRTLHESVYQCGKHPQKPDSTASELNGKALLERVLDQVQEMKSQPQGRQRDGAWEFSGVALPSQLATAGTSCECKGYGKESSNVRTAQRRTDPKPTLNIS